MSPWHMCCISEGLDGVVLSPWMVSGEVEELRADRDHDLGQSELEWLVA